MRWTNSPLSRRCFFCALALLAAAATLAAAQVPSAPTARFVVVLDAAHGGDDPGARLSGGQSEKNFTLALSIRLRSLLAARGISGFGDMHKSHAERAPLGRNVEVTEVGNTGVFLASDASSGITGEVIYVDCGYNIMGF